MSRKQILKENILALLSGEKKPEDLFPKCKMCIGYGNENQYDVNGKKVSKEAFDKAMINIEHASCRITYGEEIEDDEEI